MRFFQQMTFRGKLLVSIIAVMVISIGILTAVSSRIAVNAILAQQEAALEAAVNKAVAELNSWVGDRKRDAAIFSGNELFVAAARGNNLKAAKAALEAIHRLSPVYENVFLADTQGRIFLDSIDGKSIGIEVMKIPPFQINVEKAQKKEIWVGDVLPSPATGRPVALITAPIIENQQVIGILGTPIELENFSETFVRPVKIGKSGYLAVIDSAGLLLAHPQKDLILKLNLSKLDWGHLLFEKKFGSIHYNFQGVEKTGYFANAEKGWIVMATMTTGELYDMVKPIQRVSLALGLGVILLISGMIWIATQGIFKTIKSVAEVLSRGADQVNEASVTIASASTELSASATEQASALQETVSSIDEVNATVGKNAEGAKESSQASKLSQANAQKGKAVVGQVIRSIGEIQASYSEIAAQIDSSNQKFVEIVSVIHEIGSKTKVINDIVFQTKLLSFNASVEAARAGEHGKGFAVVAEEVGNLAQMSGNAAREIADMLDGSIKKVEDIVADTKARVAGLVASGREKIAAGTQTAEECGKVLDQIVTDAEKVNLLVEDIATASNEQALGVQEITKAMGQLDQVTHQNAIAAERVSGSANQLTAQAGQLRASVQELLISVNGGK